MKGVTQTSFQLRISDAKAEAEGYKSQLEDMKVQEAQLRGHIKVITVQAFYSHPYLTAMQTLREELRKVQTSAALLERQRNPGVGYWTSRSENTDSRASVSSASDLPSRTASPGLASPPPSKGDEEINLEYLRNVILQFLEHKEMRVSEEHWKSVGPHPFSLAQSCPRFIYHLAVYTPRDPKTDSESSMRALFPYFRVDELEALSLLEYIHTTLLLLFICIRYIYHYTSAHVLTHRCCRISQRNLLLLT